MALITGASGGIGSQIATCLAQRRYSTVLLGRDRARLTALAADLQNRFGIPSTCIPGDLTTPGFAQSVAARVRAEHPQIEVLVNCAGFAIRGRFDSADPATLLDMLQVNILAVTEFTGLFLPGMIERGAGYILNLSSVAAFMPGPMLAAYFASKAYVLSFSEALAEELAGTGVSVTAACPGPTRTGFARRAGLEGTRAFRGGHLMNPADVAQVAVDALFRKKRIVIPSLPLRLQLIPARLLPRRLLGTIAGHYHSLPGDTSPLPPAHVEPMASFFRASAAPLP